MRGGILAAYRDAFSGLEREVWWLSGVLFVNRAGTMVMPFLSLYFTQDLELGVIVAGRLVAAFGVGSICGSLLGGWLSDRWSPLTVQRASLVGSGVIFLSLIGVTHVWAMTAILFAAGLVGDVFRPAMMVSITRVSHVQNRGRAFALARLAANAGMAIGPAAGGWLASIEYDLLFVTDAITCWLAAAVLFATHIVLEDASEEEDDEESGARPRRPWRDGPFLAFLVLVTLLSMSFFQLFSMLPIHLQDHYGLSEGAVGSLIGLNAGLIVLFEMLLLRRVESVAPMKLVAFGSFCIGAGLALIPLGPPIAVAVVAICVLTLGEMLALPMTTVLVSQRAPAASQGRYMGAYMLSFSIGLVLAPMVGASLYERVSPASLWIALGITGTIVALGFAALGSKLTRRRTPRTT